MAFCDDCFAASGTLSKNFSGFLLAAGLFLFSLLSLSAQESQADTVITGSEPPSTFQEKKIQPSDFGRLGIGASIYIFTVEQANYSLDAYLNVSEKVGFKGGWGEGLYSSHWYAGAYFPLMYHLNFRLYPFVQYMSVEASHYEFINDERYSSGLLYGGVGLEAIPFETSAPFITFHLHVGISYLFNDEIIGPIHQNPSINRVFSRPHSYTMNVGIRFYLDKLAK